MSARKTLQDYIDLSREDPECVETLEGLYKYMQAGMAQEEGIYAKIGRADCETTWDYPCFILTTKDFPEESDDPDDRPFDVCIRQTKCSCYKDTVLHKSAPHLNNNALLFGSEQEARDFCETFGITNVDVEDDEEE